MNDILAVLSNNKDVLLAVSCLTGGGTDYNLETIMKLETKIMNDIPLGTQLPDASMIVVGFFFGEVLVRTFKNKNAHWDTESDCVLYDSTVIVGSFRIQPFRRLTAFMTESREYRMSATIKTIWWMDENEGKSKEELMKMADENGWIKIDEDTSVRIGNGTSDHRETCAHPSDKVGVDELGYRCSICGYRFGAMIPTDEVHSLTGSRIFKSLDGVKHVKACDNSYVTVDEYSTPQMSMKEKINFMNEKKGIILIGASYLINEPDLKCKYDIDSLILLENKISLIYDVDIPIFHTTSLIVGYVLANTILENIGGEWSFDDDTYIKIPLDGYIAVIRPFMRAIYYWADDRTAKLSHIYNGLLTLKGMTKDTIQELVDDDGYVTFDNNTKIKMQVII